MSQKFKNSKPTNDRDAKLELMQFDLSNVDEIPDFDNICVFSAGFTLVENEKIKQILNSAGATRLALYFYFL